MFAFLLPILPLPERFGLLSRCLRQPCRPRIYRARRYVRGNQANTLRSEDKFSKLIGMGHTSGFENVKAPIALSVQLYIAQQNPRVHKRRNAYFRLLLCLLAGRQAREHRGDLSLFEKIDEAHQHGMNFIGIAGYQVGYRIHNYNVRFELFDQLMDAQKMHFQTTLCGAPRPKLESFLADVSIEIDADGAHIANGLIGGFFESDVKTSLSRPT